MADTGNEHEITMQYRLYIQEKLGMEITLIRADFSRQLAAKADFVRDKWASHGVDPALIKSALETLKPTGNPFLDLCIWKGRFPSRMAQFCTQNLKKIPLMKFQSDLQAQGFEVESWQGVRADESEARNDLPECEATPEGVKIVRPIIAWKVPQVFEIHRKYGVEPNPLYKLGMGRVGCMPCINARKSELAEINRRFHGHIERIAEWERIVSLAAKKGMATFFNVRNLEGNGFANEDVNLEEHGIEQFVKWAQTERGGKWEDLEYAKDAPACASIYGLCE